MQFPITLKVNDDQHDLAVEPHKTLLDVLRNNLGLTGTNEGCSTGDCGACTVIMDGKPVNSCLVLAVDANGSEITTVEGLVQNSELHPVQKAFVKYGAIQCGFCTPGMIMSTVALLNEIPNPTEEEIRRGVEGNLCRCTGYAKVVEAVRAAIDESL